MRTVVLWLALLTCYIVLSGQIHNATLVTGGVLGSTLVVLLTAWMGLHDDETVPWRQWPATLRYTPWLLWQIVLANWDVLKRVVAFDPQLSPTLVVLPHRLKSPYAQATYANSITLTPGTVTIAIDETTLLVYSITKSGADDLAGGGMHDKVAAIFEPGHAGNRLGNSPPVNPTPAHFTSATSTSATSTSSNTPTTTSTSRGVTP